MPKKKKPDFSATRKASPVFVVLIAIVVAAFVYAMVSIGRLPTPEEKQKAIEDHLNEVMIAEEAQAAGLAPEVVKRQWQERDEKQRLTSELRRGIEKNDEKSTASSLILLTQTDISTYGVFLLSEAVDANNETAFERLLKKGIPCNPEIATGNDAFKKAARSSNLFYLKAMHDNHCFQQTNPQAPSFEKRLVDSPFPERIFQLPSEYVDERYRDEAFLKAVALRTPEQVLTMLDLGANPNAVSLDGQDRSALITSLISDKPKISLHLIIAGADIYSRDRDGRHALTYAFMKGHLDVAREILILDPNYLLRDSVACSSSVYTFAFNKNPDARREAFQMLVQHVPDPSQLEDGGHCLMTHVMRLGDPVLVKTLLDAGLHRRDPKKVQELLERSQSRNDPNKHEILLLLEQALKARSRQPAVR